MCVGSYVSHVGDSPTKRVSFKARSKKISSAEIVLFSWLKHLWFLMFFQIWNIWLVINNPKASISLKRYKFFIVRVLVVPPWSWLLLKKSRHHIFSILQKLLSWLIQVTRLIPIHAKYLHSPRDPLMIPFLYYLFNKYLFDALLLEILPQLESTSLPSAQAFAKFTISCTRQRCALPSA